MICDSYDALPPAERRAMYKAEVESRLDPERIAYFASLPLAEQIALYRQELGFPPSPS